MSNIIELYAVHSPGDERRSGHPKWFFTEGGDAEIVADGRGWYGGKATISKVWGIQNSDGKLYRLFSPEPIVVDDPIELSKVREKALAKLSPLERRVLGL